MPHHKKMSVFGVAALGIGSMVGAGLFALLGQVALDVRSDTWIVFVCSGIVALFSGYSYARLCAHYPSRGGVTDFFRLGFRSARIERTFSILYMVTIVITLALIGKAFGAYLAHVLHQSIDSKWVNIYASGILILLTIINLMGAKTVGRIELVLVSIKLLILGAFIVAGALTLKPHMLSVHSDVSTHSIFSAMGLAFFAYSGYGLMASAAGDVKNPERDMPRAFMLAIGCTMVLYVIMALVVLGNVTPEDLAKYSDTAVAQAAEPILGYWGFVLMSFAALVATGSSIIANIFSLLNISREMGSVGTLPKMFRLPMIKSTRGFYCLLAIVLLLANFVNLSAIADVASATFLMCYLAVFWVSWKVRHEIHAKSWILLLGFASMIVIFSMFVGGMATHGKWSELIMLLGAVVVSFALAWREHPAEND